MPRKTRPPIPANILLLVVSPQLLVATCLCHLGKAGGRKLDKAVSFSAAAQISSGPPIYIFIPGTDVYVTGLLFFHAHHVWFLGQQDMPDPAQEFPCDLDYGPGGGHPFFEFTVHRHQCRITTHGLPGTLYQNRL